MIIRNCNLIDCTGRSPYRAAIKISDGKILDIQEDLTGDGETIDAKGAYLMPGLINSHVHINRRHVSRAKGAFRNLGPVAENSTDGRRMLYAAKNAWYELNQGVTALRDLCSVGRTASELKAALEAGVIRGPGWWYAAKPLPAPAGTRPICIKARWK